MKKVIENIKSAFTDITSVQTCVLSVILIVCNLSIFEFKNDISHLVRGCSVGLILLGVIFFGKKSLVYTMFIHAMAVLYFNRYYNYTSFVIIMTCIILDRKLLKPYLIIYVLGALSCLVLYKDGFDVAVIHIVWCIVFYLEFDRMRKLFDSLFTRNRELEEEVNRLTAIINEKENLNLTDDEILIIEKLAKGLEIKEIDEFSESTVYIKLKNARERNSLTSNDDLISAFRRNLD